MLQRFAYRVVPALPPKRMLKGGMSFSSNISIITDALLCFHVQMLDLSFSSDYFQNCLCSHYPTIRISRGVLVAGCYLVHMWFQHTLLFLQILLFETQSLPFIRGIAWKTQENQWCVKWGCFRVHIELLQLWNDNYDKVQAYWGILAKHCVRQVN